MAHKLLLADDSVTIQRVIALTFAEEDVEVVAVSDGQQAIDRMDADPPDIVLADIDMPKRDGYEVAAYVKSRPQLAHIPVVLLTGAFEPVDQARAAASGSSDVLTKPFEPQMVINRVKALLGKKRYDPPGASQTPPTFPVQPARSQPMRAPQAPVGEPSAAEDAGGPVSLDDYFDQLDAAFANIHGAKPAAQAPADPAAAASIHADSKHDRSLNDEFDWITQPPKAGAPNAGPTRGSRAWDPSAAPALGSGPKASAPPQPPVQPQARSAPPAPAEPARAAAPARPAPAPAPPPLPKAPAAFAKAPASLDEAQERSRASLDEAGLPLPPAARAPVAAAPVPRPAAPPPKAAPAPAPNPFAALSVAAKTETAAIAGPAAVPDEIIEDVCARVLSRLSDRVVRETVTGLVSEIAERLVREEIEKMKAGGL